MGFEVLTAVKTSMLVFWVVTPCRPVGRYQRFGGTYCLHLQRPTSTFQTDTYFYVLGIQWLKVSCTLQTFTSKYYFKIKTFASESLVYTTLQSYKDIKNVNMSATAEFFAAWGRKVRDWTVCNINTLCMQAYEAALWRRRTYKKVQDYTNRICVIKITHGWLYDGALVRCWREYVSPLCHTSNLQEISAHACRTAWRQMALKNIRMGKEVTAHLAIHPNTK
jgi:hypothetical protein